MIIMVITIFVIMSKFFLLYKLLYILFAEKHNHFTYGGTEDSNGEHRAVRRSHVLWSHHGSNADLVAARDPAKKSSHLLYRFIHY